MTEADYLRLVDETNAAGPYKPTWESLAQMEIPAWFTREHLGIFIHWGAYCVPAATDEWYPRNMYMKEKPAYTHHLQAFGPHREIGYKDIIPMFRAERFDPVDWMQLFRRAGAGYVFPVAEHHDGFQMYKSELSHWNAAEKGPCRDVLGELRAAAEREGLALICVTLNDPNDWSDHAALFDYGFSAYRAEPAAEEGEVLCRVPTVGSLTPFCPAAAGEGLSLCLASGEEVKRELRLDRETLEGPLPAGTQIGEAVYYLQDKELGRVPLVTARPVSGDRTESRDLLSRLRDRLDELSG